MEPTPLRVVRVFHAGRNPAHRARDRALVAAGAEVTYVVPRTWSEQGGQTTLSPEPFGVVEVDVTRPGDVNRHRYADPDALARLVTGCHPDVVDLCEEPVSSAAAQLLPRLPPDLPVVMYSAQNLDKRFPPPFCWYERRAMRRVQAFYPCSEQAGAVLRGKGYGGLIRPLPLGYDPITFTPGRQSLAGPQRRLALAGRMVPEKGVADAVGVLAALRRRGMDARLSLVGAGPALAGALELAAARDVADAVDVRPWLDAPELARLYRDTHVVLTPSRSTATWVEQYGRMITEAQASGCVVAGYTSGSIPEVGGEAAVVVAEGDTAGLAEAVARLLGDEPAWATRRQAGMHRAGGRTWSAVARQQIDLYRAALGRPPGSWVAGSPAARRRAATAELGPPAQALGQARPFAAPLLRRPTPAARAVGRGLDALGEVRGLLDQGRVTTES